jgi:hypothetical protein
MFTKAITARNVIFALLGACAFGLKRLYAGPHAQAVHAYAGNFSVSFALYFVALNATRRSRHPRLLAAVATLMAVTAFEVTDGFGVMANVYDPADILANAAGIGFALLVDAVSYAFIAGRVRS